MIPPSDSSQSFVICQNAVFSWLQQNSLLWQEITVINVYSQEMVSAVKLSDKFY